jgi:anti-anti-sigma factor
MDVSFTVSSHRVGSSEVIEVAGELDLATAPKLEEVLDRMLVIPHEIVVDVTGLTFVDSSGLRLLLRASELVGGRIQLKGCSTRITHLLDIAGISAAFNIDNGRIS